MVGERKGLGDGSNMHLYCSLTKEWLKLDDLGKAFQDHKFRIVLTRLSTSKTKLISALIFF